MNFPSDPPLDPVSLDWHGFLRNLRREGTPKRVYYFEHGVADNVQAAIAERFGVWDSIAESGPALDWKRREAMHAFLGQELFRVFPPGARIVPPKREGAWAEETRGAITTWEEFESFDWPDPAAADYSVLEYCGNCYAGIYLGDDLAFKTSLFMAPDLLRELIVPWHQRIADIAHAHGTPAWIAEKTREILNVCQPGGGYFLGSGN